MLVKEYLERAGLTKHSNEKLTFVIGKAAKWENAPGYYMEYRSTPIRCVWEWLEGNGSSLDYIMIDEAQPPVGDRVWVNWYMKGHLKCFLIISKEELYKIYSQEQAESMIRFWEKEILTRMK